MTPRGENQASCCTICVLYSGFIPSSLYMPLVILMMIIVLEPCSEVMNHYDLSCQLSILYALCIFYILLYLYHDIIVQVISCRWCARVPVTLPLTCLRHQMPTATTTFAARESRAAASHAERAHAGVDGDPLALWSKPATPPVGDGLLYRLPGDTPSDVHRGG
jgi:hypothetical protein